MSKDIQLIIPGKLDFTTITDIVTKKKKIALSDEAKKRVVDCRNYLDTKLSDSEDIIYGVNTGFGSLCNTVISSNDLAALQRNLVVSHACGMGEEVPVEIVELILLLKIQGLAGGNSGIDLQTIERLIDFSNNKVTPVIYQQGSLGASGDLAPLAHLSLPLLGKGEVNYKGEKIAAEKLEQLFSWKPIELQSKEGLALLNGTQFMSAYGTYLLLKLERLIKLGDLVAAVSYEAFDCKTDPLNALVHQVRGHEGQVETARFLSSVLEGSSMQTIPKKHVQDPYSFRCIPQVHGATKDVISNVKRVFEIEINSVTDNPTIFPESDEIISAGNFHGQPLALHLDFLAIAVAELASIAERRIYKLLSGERNLPLFLTPQPGLNSGFMIPQYTAASIVSQNKQLCTPASIDTIDSSNGQEDHVSMGANAATKAFKVVENYEKIMSIELMNAVQALEFRRPHKSSAQIEELVSNFRKEVPSVNEDTEMYVLMKNSLNFIRNSK